MKKILLVFGFLLLAFDLAFGAVASDSCNTSSTNAGTSLTWPLTITGTNPYVVVTFHGEGGGGVTSGATYNGVNMDLKEILYPGFPGLEVYEKALGTADGASHSAVISTTSTIMFVGSACSFTGVDQTTPSGTVVTNLGDPLDSGSVTVPANGMAYEIAVWGHNGACTPAPTVQAAGQTSAFTAVCANDGGNQDIGFASTRTTTGSFQWDLSGGAYTASVAIPINAATTTATVRRRVME